jgi:hypothetical protein
MTNIGYISINTSMAPRILQHINSMVLRIQANPVVINQKHYPEGMFTEIKIGNERILVRPYYSKDKKEISKISFKVYGDAS